MDPKGITVNSLKRACTVFEQDLQAIPVDGFDRAFGDKTRSVADIVFEVNLVNDHVRMVLRGDQPFAWPDEGWIKAPDELRSKGAVLDSFLAARDRMLATVEGFSLDDLQGTIQTENGETTRFQRVQFLIIHLWYHSGQLNYIQTLLGDDAWHWS